MICFSEFPSRCDLPAFEPNQPNKKPARANRARHRECPKRYSAGCCWSIVIALVYILIRIHQVAVKVRGRVSRVARHRLLCFQLFDAGLELLVASKQCLITRLVHVVTVMVRPPRLILDAPIQQPPPEETAVGIMIN